MKTLAASEDGLADDERFVNRIENFWSADVSGLYQVIPLPQTLRFRWERWDERNPEVRGEELLTLTLTLPEPGRLYTLPAWDIQAEYTMATPSKVQGARAVEFKGVVRIVDRRLDGLNVWLDLKARMARIDAPGVEFDEAVRGLFRVNEMTASFR